MKILGLKRGRKRVETGRGRGERGRERGEGERRRGREGGREVLQERVLTSPLSP